MGLSRDTLRRVSHASALNAELRQENVTVAYQGRRWAYRMIHDRLRPKYPNINHKCVYRHYTAESLSIRKHKKTKRIGMRVQLVATQTVNQTGVWTF